MSDQIPWKQLAEFVIGLRFESIPREAIQKAQEVTLYDLSVAFGGASAEQFEKALELTRSLSVPATDVLLLARCLA